MTVDVLMPCFALVVIGLTGWMIVKRYQTAMVLLMAGLSMIIFAVVCGVTGVLPKGMKSSGLIWFDVIDLLRSIAVKQVSGRSIDYGSWRLCRLHGSNRSCSSAG